MNMEFSNRIIRIINQSIFLLFLGISSISVASANLIIASGDSTPAYYASVPDNNVFFENILQGGTAVLGTELSTSSIGGFMNDFYNDLPGVSSTYMDSAVITPSLLSGVDLFVTGLYDGPLSSSELSALNDFVSSGGSVMFMGEYTYSYDSINAALAGIGSGMSLYGDVLDPGNNYAGVAADALTAGVGTFTYGATYGVSGGTSLFYDSTGRTMMAYEGETSPETSVPEPASFMLLGMGLLGVTLSARARKRMM